MLLVVQNPKTAVTSLRQALVGHFPLTKYGAYFCPEQYCESLALINQGFGLNLAHKNRNRGPRGHGLRLASERPPDGALYREPRAEFRQRLRSAMARQESMPVRDRLISSVN